MPTGGIKIVCEANLSSLARAEEVNSRGERIVTRTTTTCTPTYLRNIEQLFLEAENSSGPDMQKNAAGFAPPIVNTTVTTTSGRTYVNLDSKNWQQGGVTTVVTPSSSTAPLFSELQLQLQPATMDQENSRSSTDDRKVNRGGGRKPADVKDEDLCPEEEERRRVRRERNKLAAARCRKRRVDQTDTLQEEVNVWEDKKRALQEEIHALQAQKEELKFILDAHKTVCKRTTFRPAGNMANRLIPVPTSLQVSGPRVVVKAEPQAEDTVRHLTHAEAMEEVDITTATTTSSLPGNGKPQRPQFLGLSLPKGSNLMRSIGVPIETPTSIVTSLNFDALMDGRTGLTPTNVLTPISINMSLGSNSLNTPSISTPAGCGSQQMRSGHGMPSSVMMGELGSPSAATPNLVSL